MKVALLFTLSLVVCQSISAQEVSVKWSKEIKIEKNAGDLSFFSDDLSGLYLSQRITSGNRHSAHLMKINNELQFIFQENYTTQLKGKNFEQFVFLRDHLYIISSEETNSRYSVYGVEVEQESGKLINNWVLLTEFEKQDKYDKTDLRISTNTDSSAIIICGIQQSRVRNEFNITEVQKDLTITKTILLYNATDPSVYQLDELIFTPHHTIMMAGRVLEYQESKKNRKKLVEISNYNIQLYDDSGKLLKQYNTTIDGKSFSSAKVFQTEDKLILAAFYSKNLQAESIDGLFIQHIDPKTGEILNTINKEITLNSLEPSAARMNLAEESAEQRKEREDFERFRNISDELSGKTKFQNIYFTKAGEMIIIAEKYLDRTYEINRTAIIGGSEHGNISYNTRYESGDLMICKISAGNEFEWIKVVPKKQSESNGYLFSGFTSHQKGDLIHIIFNDHPYNAKMVQPGQQLSTINTYNNTICYILTLDMKTGVISRKSLFSNNNHPVLQPQRTLLLNNHLYFLAQEAKAVSKPSVNIGKLDFK